VGGSPKAPEAPDPAKTAAAQAGMNVDTAQAQQLTNMVNQVGPDGSLTYTKTGENSFVNSQGKTVIIPNYTATTQLSESGKLLDSTNKQTQQNISQIGLDQSKRIGDLLGTPVDLNNEETEGRLMDLGRKRLDPMLQQSQQATEAKLAAQGLAPGSEAWNRAMTVESQKGNDAYNQLLLTGRAQSVQEALAARNQPINEISALLNGGQVSQPNFVSTPQSQVAGVDYAGMVQNKYQGELAAWQQKVNSQDAMMGGLFGMAAAVPKMFSFSDARLKTGIRRVGQLANGLGVYLYRIFDRFEVGVLAHEVLAVRPGAVRFIGPYMAVDYGGLQ
jgi:hypothetical protein